MEKLKNVTEIRWHGRGGQGAVTATKIVADAAQAMGHYIQSFPEYGPERTGAPLRAYNRISDKPMTMHCAITNPDVVVVIDPTLIQTGDLKDGTDGETVFIMNTQQKAGELKEKLGIEGPLFTVDATQIALDCLGRSLFNSPMMGALVQAAELMPLEKFLEQVEKTLSKSFPEGIVKGNLEAIKRAAEEVSE